MAYFGRPQAHDDVVERARRAGLSMNFCPSRFAQRHPCGSHRSSGMHRRQGEDCRKAVCRSGTRALSVAFAKNQFPVWRMKENPRSMSSYY